MAYMYYVNLGLKANYGTTGAYQGDYGLWGNGTHNGTDTSTFGQRDIGLIDNLQAHIYWSDLQNQPDTNYAWTFEMFSGRQVNDRHKGGSYRVWAVSDGDIAGASSPGQVPEPGILGLLALGLLGLGLVRRRG